MVVPEIVVEDIGCTGVVVPELHSQKQRLCYHMIDMIDAVAALANMLIGAYRKVLAVNFLCRSFPFPRCLGCLHRVLDTW